MSAHHEDSSQNYYTGRGTDHESEKYTNGKHAGPSSAPIGMMSGAAGAAVKNQATISQVYDPSFFKIANPGPLGLISFALTTFVLGLYQCGTGFASPIPSHLLLLTCSLPNSNALGNVGPDQAVFGLALFYGGAAQFVAGIMEFRAGNTFGTTLHCSYGAFWLAFAMFLIPGLAIREAYEGDTRAYTVAVGIFLIMWCFLTLIFFVAALKTNLAVLVVLGCLVLAFFFLALAQFLAVPHPASAKKVNQVGGAWSVICATAAFYAGASGLMRPETTWVRFPLGEFANKQPTEKSPA